MGVTASSRLRSQREFQEVRNQGIRILCGPFIFQADCGGCSDAPRKLGVIASRRVGNAVKRNLGKRRIREIFRLNESALPDSSRVVIVLRASYNNHSFDDLQKRFLKACKRYSAQVNCSRIESR